MAGFSQLAAELDRKAAEVYARLNMIFGAKDKVDAGLAHIEDSDRSAVEATPGNRGLVTLVDREAAVIIAVSYWDEPQRSSEALLTQARAAAAAAAGGDVVTENYKVVAGKRLRTPTGGAAVRMARVQVDHAHVADVDAFYRGEVIPQLERCAGLCSAELLIDPDSGNGVSVTVWEDAEAATGAERVLERLRDEASQRLGAKFPRVESYLMVQTSVQFA